MEVLAPVQLPVTVDWLAHYTADMAGFKGAQFLKQIVSDTGAHLVLHGHHHNPTSPDAYTRRAGGVAPVLSVGSCNCLGARGVNLLPGDVWLKRSEVEGHCPGRSG